MSKSKAISIKKYGRSMTETRSIEHLVMPQPTNKTEPTGGVIEPMHMLKINMTPKWTGSMPKLMQIGRKIGVKIRIAGVMSKNMPTTSKMKFTMKKMTYLFSEIESRPLAMASGMPE